MCEHEWITTRAVYRTSTTDGYKNHEINRRVCINCLKTQDETDLENQLAAANARIAELEANLQYAEFVRKEFESALMNNDNAVEAYKYWRQRAEQAEEKVKRLIKKITFNTPRLDNFGDNEYLLSIDENDIIPAEPCVCDKMEQAEAQCAAMRIRFEKYVRDNCKLIRHSVADGFGYPDDVEGKCGGYCQNYDEPHYVCQECVAAYDPENDYNEGIIDAASALLARMERMRKALEALIGLCENGADFRNGNMCQGIDEGNVMADRVIEEARAVLDGRDGKPGKAEGKKAGINHD